MIRWDSIRRELKTIASPFSLTLRVLPISFTEGTTSVVPDSPSAKETLISKRGWICVSS